MASTGYWFGIRGTHGLYRVRDAGPGRDRHGLDPARWTGTKWVYDDVWLGDWLEGRFDPDSVPVDEVEDLFPGSTSTAAT